MKSVKGSFLIASPHLVDPNFAQTVVFMTEHNEEGSFGLVVNRPAHLKIAKLWEAVGGDGLAGVQSTAADGSDSIAFVGGPVESRVIHFLHNCEDLAQGQEAVVPGVYIGNDAELFGSLLEREAHLKNEGAESECYRAFCGFSGWGEGQLDHELETNSWIVQPASASEVFSGDIESQWASAMRKQGGIYGIFANMPKNPELN